MEGKIALILISILSVMIHEVVGHGRLLDPAGRSSMWRYGFKTPPNYSDNQLFCGGTGVQYSSAVAGRCGVCGDPFNGPKPNEAGGKYANGIIVRQYKMAETIAIKIQITANHKGWTEFKLCPTNDKTIVATQDCMDRNVLERADGQGTRFPIASGMLGEMSFNVKLPAGISCSQCVLQWRYHTGNSWGTDPDGTSCVGCGNQEEFYGCADIEISSSNVIVPMTYPAEAVTMPMNDPKMPDYVAWEWDTEPATTRNPTSSGYSIKAGVLIYLVYIAMGIIFLN